MYDLCYRWPQVSVSVKKAGSMRHPEAISFTTLDFPQHTIIPPTNVFVLPLTAETGPAFNNFL